MDYICIKCNKALNKKTNCCGSNYIIKDKFISYDFEKFLFQKFRNDYLLNKVLNNNGHLSYLYLPEGSLSLADREDVMKFDEFVLTNYKNGNILDVGCGIIETPGYLNSVSKLDNKLFGLDPLADTRFKGHKIIGCAEYIPFEDSYFDTIIFATSIDHVCNLDQTFKEANRILKSDGKLIIWHSYPKKSKLLSRFYYWIEGLLKGTSINKNYFYYPENDVVFYIPKGAVDPYHKEYIKFKQLIKIAATNGFKLLNEHDFDGSSYFFAFSPE